MGRVIDGDSLYIHSNGRARGATVTVERECLSPMRCAETTVRLNKSAVTTSVDLCPCAGSDAMSHPQPDPPTPPAAQPPAQPLQMMGQMMQDMAAIAAQQLVMLRQRVAICMGSTAGGCSGEVAATGPLAGRGLAAQSGRPQEVCACRRRRLAGSTATARPI